MIVPDWFIKLLQALGLKDTPEKAKNKEIKMYESELRKLDARIKQNKAQIESFELDLNELENEKKQLMAKYKTVTDATQKKMLAANFDAATNKINSISKQIGWLQKDNNTCFAQSDAIKLIIVNANGPDTDTIETTKELASDAKENIVYREELSEELKDLTVEDSPAVPSAIEQALAAEIAKESAVSAIEAAIAETEKNKTTETVEQ
jgi:predicted ribosome quality control (RQC) complex YloA/Tae2 family protein